MLNFIRTISPEMILSRRFAAPVLALVCCILLAPGYAFSQKTKTPPAKTPPAKTPPSAPAAVKDTAIAKLFEKPSDIKWVRYFKGRFDDVSVVDIALGYDGKNCRGYLNYSKSGDRFRLDGTLDGKILNLEERDGSKAITGRLRGNLDKRRIDAEWTNHNNSLGSFLDAEELAPGQIPNYNCSENKWAGRYITRFNGARADMILIRIHNGSLYGYLWVESDAKTYDLHGEMDREGNYEIEALLPSGKMAGLLQGNLKNLQSTDCNWVGSGEKRTFKFTQRNNYQLGCYDFADYNSSYDAIYPLTNCKNCNTWLDQQVNTWLTECKATIAAQKKQRIPANRSAQRATCWAEIACLTENLLSGYLTYSETWNKQSRGQSFSFDLRSGKLITFDDLFNKSFNINGWLDDFSKRESPKLPHYGADPEYREWLAREGFPMFTLRREGLELSTLFHTQYGRQTLLVPYANLKPYMKKDNPVSDLVK
ncbi:MAG: hypothetical protein IPK76_08190 [Lewinellaceae bacterium]|nr:hypothetical protein [Lewinellaceae bacterium]